MQHHGPWGNGVLKTALFLAAPQTCEEFNLCAEETMGGMVEGFLAWGWSGMDDFGEKCANTLAQLCGLLLLAGQIPGSMSHLRMIGGVKSVADLEHCAVART